jgi:hypothetical protein
MKNYPIKLLFIIFAFISYSNLNAVVIQFDGITIYYGENPNISEIESHPNYSADSGISALRKSLYDLNGTFTFSDTSGNIYDNLLSVDLNLTMFSDYSNLNDFININFDTFETSDLGQQIGTYSLDSFFGNNLVFKIDDWEAEDNWALYFESSTNETAEASLETIFRDPGISFYGFAWAEVFDGGRNITAYDADFSHEIPSASTQSSYPIYYVFNTVPEPSTYALILGGLALGFVTLRRK